MLTAPPRTADPTTQRRRRLQFAAALASMHLRTALVPENSVRRRQRVQICSAARLLTALGVRVRVVSPSVPWPRHRPYRVVVTDDVGWLGGLALVTGLPRGTPAWQAVVDRVLRGNSWTVGASVQDGVACPVAVRYSSDAGPLDRPPRTVAEIVAVHGLVVEVHLLPPLDLSVTATPPVLAAAA